MRAKHWLALFLILTLAVGVTVMPTLAVESLLDGTGDLIGDTVTFSVKADDETVIYTGEDVVATFTVEVANDSNKELHAFSFMLEPSQGLTLATALKDDGEHKAFYYDYPADTGLLDYYKTFDYSSVRRYFGAAKENGTGTGIVNGSKTVLTIMGKISAPGDYTLTMNTTDKDKVVVAGQVNGTGSSAVSQYFERAVNGATVRVVNGGVISGTVKNDADQPMGGAAVTLKDSKGDVAAETVADESGSYTLPAVANGDYTLSVSATVGDKTLSGRKAVTVNGSGENGYQVDAGAINVQQFQKGDVNKDGLINSDDVTRLLRHVAKIEALSDDDVALGDVTGDNLTNADDVTKLLRFVSKIITSLD